jgi:protein SCO1/2
MRTLFAALLICLLLPPGALGAQDYSDFGFHQHPGAHVPMGQPLQDEAGHMVTLQAISGGHPMILILGYFHCPNLCGIVRGDALQALSQSGLQPNQYTLVVLSIDPRETSQQATAAKQEDLSRFPMPGGDKAWHYLIGSPDVVRRLAQTIGFPYRYDSRLKQYLHPAGLTFLSPSGQVSGYLLGVGYSPGDLALDVASAGANRLTRLASSIVLLCCNFDPATGRYTLAIMKLLQLAGLLTVLTVGGTIALALRRERSS